MKIILEEIEIYLKILIRKNDKTLIELRSLNSRTNTTVCKHICGRYFIFEKKLLPLQSLLELHALGSSHNDPNLLDFLETEYLQEQVDAIKEISDHITNLERVGDGLGVFIFDKELKE